MNSPEQRILAAIERTRSRLGRSVVVALDGASGAGKSTLAKRLQRMMQVALVHLDDFYQTSIPESSWSDQTLEQRLRLVFDWHRVRTEAIEPLRAGKTARWHAFDFWRGLNDAGTYDLQNEVTVVEPAPVILLEGAYSASPPLRDLIDLAVLVSAAKDEKERRAANREREHADFLTQWHAIWDDVEAHYFASVCPPSSFDLVVSSEREDEEVPRYTASEKLEPTGQSTLRSVRSYGAATANAER